MALVLNEFEIKGHSLKVAATLQLPADDMSGNSSFSDTAETGDKPKKISVGMQIKFDDDKNLTQLINLAEAKSNSDQRVVYNIINGTAKAMNIRQVRFEGDVAVREDETLRLWSVMFKLSEVRSVPEKKAARVDDLPVTDQALTGETVDQVDSAVPSVEQLDRFEKILQFVEDSVTPDDET